MGVHPCGAERIPSSTPRGDSVAGNPSRAVGGGDSHQEGPREAFSASVWEMRCHVRNYTVIYHQLETSSQTGRN